MEGLDWLGLAAVIFFGLVAIGSFVNRLMGGNAWRGRYDGD